MVLNWDIWCGKVLSSLFLGKYFLGICDQSKDYWVSSSEFLPDWISFMPGCGRSIAIHPRFSDVQYSRCQVNAAKPGMWPRWPCLWFPYSWSLWTARINLAVARWVLASTRFESFLDQFSKYLIQNFLFITSILYKEHTEMNWKQLKKKD